jgi:flagellar hook-associated protein 1
MSLVTFLSIARTALMTQQRAMDVTANNVANAQTAGYRRQRLLTTEAMPLMTAFGTVGRGIEMLGVDQARDLFHDASFRQDNGLLGRASTLADLYGQVEASLNEPSDTGVTGMLDGFFNAFADLGNSPSSSANREQVRRAASRLIERLHTLDSDVSRAISNATDEIRNQLGEVNSLTQRIADLNSQVLATGGPSHMAPDVKDQRDALVDQLSGMVGIKVSEHDDGTISVTSGSVALVDRGMARQLELRSGGGTTLALGVVGDPGAFDPQTGSLDGLLESVNTGLPNVRAQLDTLAGALVAQVNALHHTGTTSTGATNTDFFDATGVTAGSIQLAAPILASSDAIATGTTGAAGDGGVAAAIAGLRGTNLAALGGRTLRDYMVDLATGVGSATRDAEADMETYQALADRSDALRQSVTGVNLDEEMVALVGQQQAYSAAARLISIADDMMRDLLSMI